MLTRLIECSHFEHKSHTELEIQKHLDNVDPKKIEALGERIKRIEAACNAYSTKVAPSPETPVKVDTPVEEEPVVEVIDDLKDLPLPPPPRRHK